VIESAIDAVLAVTLMVGRDASLDSIRMPMVDTDQQWQQAHTSTQRKPSCGNTHSGLTSRGKGRGRGGKEGKDGSVDELHGGRFVRIQYPRQTYASSVVVRTLAGF
jgi:hypothetical protein